MKAVYLFALLALVSRVSAQASLCSGACTDTTAPVLVVPGTKNVDCSVCLDATNECLGAALARDDCPVNITYTDDEQILNGCPESTELNRLIRRTFFAVDSCGNNSTATQIIIVDDRRGPLVRAILRPINEGIKQRAVIERPVDDFSLGLFADKADKGLLKTFDVDAASRQESQRFRCDAPTTRSFLVECRAISLCNVSVDATAELKITHFVEPVIVRQSALSGFSKFSTAPVLLREPVRDSQRDKFGPSSSSSSFSQTDRLSNLMNQFQSNAPLRRSSRSQSSQEALRCELVETEIEVPCNAIVRLTLLNENECTALLRAQAASGDKFAPTLISGGNNDFLSFDSQRTRGVRDRSRFDDDEDSSLFDDEHDEERLRPWAWRDEKDEEFEFDNNGRREFRKRKVLEIRAVSLELEVEAVDECGKENEDEFNPALDEDPNCQRRMNNKCCPAIENEELEIRDVSAKDSLLGLGAKDSFLGLGGKDSGLLGGLGDKTFGLPLVGKDDTSDFLSNLRSRNAESGRSRSSRGRFSGWQP